MITKLTTFPSRLSLIAILVGLTAAPLHAATAPVGVVAGSWQTAPGTGYNYNWVGQPRGGQLTDDGIVSFVGNLGGLSAQGLWSGTPGAMSAIALPGQPAPGYTNSTYYGTFFDIQRLDKGQYLFGGSVTSTGQALWKGTAGSLTRILKKGDAVVPGSTSTFGPIDFVTNHGSNASDGSSLAWWGPVGNKSSIVIGTPGNYRIAQTTNDQFFSNGWQTMSQLYAPSVSKPGNAVFKADYTQSNQSKSMLRIANMTATSSLAQEGDSVPGMTGFTWGSNFSSPVINDAGQVLFRGSAQRNFPYDFRSGFWLSNAARTAYTSFARGEQAPGMATGVVLSSGNDYRLNNDGEVAFISRLSGSGVTWDVNDISIWAGAPTALQMAMRLGDVAPGTGGASFASLSWQYGIQQYTNAYQLNDDGQVAFFAQLKGTGVNTSNDIGLWLFDPTAKNSLLIAREGEQIDIGNGSFKTISELYSPYRSDAFNNLGQISFGAKFTDGSQAILLSNVVAVPVPEPESWAMLLAGLGLISFAARRRT
jgi:hypothetical protein